MRLMKYAFRFAQGGETVRGVGAFVQVIGLCIVVALLATLWRAEAAAADTRVRSEARTPRVSPVLQVQAEKLGSGVLVRRTAKGNAYVYDVITAKHVIGSNAKTVTLRAHVYGKKSSIPSWTGTVRAVPCGPADNNRSTVGERYNPCIIDVAWVQFSSQRWFPVMDIDTKQQFRSVEDVMRTSFEVLINQNICLRGFPGGEFQEYCDRRPYYVITDGLLGTFDNTSRAHGGDARTLYSKFGGAIATMEIRIEPGMSGGAVYKNNQLLGIATRGSNVIYYNRSGTVHKIHYMFAVPIGLVCALWKDVCTPSRGS
ncbi:MAG: trypsin-like peptidase domain-containing protein [Paenibacillaceae bacterium]|nr:trypsin-like peptidase domain-containing protein [Paenibacillaceae bacterium]